MNTAARYAVLAAALLAITALAAACTDDGEEAAPGLDPLAAITFLDSVGLHGIDEAINEEGDIPDTAASDVRKAQAAVALGRWPDDLRDEAAALEQILGDLAAELEKESPSLDVAGDLAARSHDGQHDFSHAVWAHLREEAGQTVDGGAADGHD